MYRVLLVDDEPLILSGLKFMLNWENAGCTLAGTARNGRQALDLICTLNPDIVIADINMPVMNGLELLKEVQKDRPYVAFIMLTNLQEFGLIQEALRLGAVDYLVKTQLDENTLSEGLSRACARAGEYRRAALADAVRQDTERESEKLLESAVKRLFGKIPLADIHRNALRECGVWDAYGAAEVRLPPSDESADELCRLFRWESEMAENLAVTFFRRHIAVKTEEPCLLLLYWVNPGDSQTFAEKLTAVSCDVIGTEPCIFLCGPYIGEQSVGLCGEHLDALRKYQYLTGENMLFFEDIPQIQYLPIAPVGISSRLEAELNSRSSSACELLLERLIDKASSTPHEKDEMLWLCGELYSVAHKVFSSLPGNHFFSDETAGTAEIGRLRTRELAVNWLKKLKNELVALLEPSSPGHWELLDKARRYVTDNIGKRILLKDAANAACISPAYLSALFKKEYGQNFVDFVNQTKIKRACEMIEQGNYRINEIGYMLGFENADYFSKVFRRHTGMTPTDYQHHHD